MKKSQIGQDAILRKAEDMISSAFDAVWEECKDENNRQLPVFPDFPSGDLDSVQKEVLAFFTDIVRLLEEKRQDRKNALPDQVMSYIGENYGSFNLTLQELSKLFGVSKTVLCQQFRSSTGMTIGEYILKIRMVQAKGMFEKGYHNVAYVAEKCGYEDAGYFSKCFKKYFGISPKTYCDARG